MKIENKINFMKGYTDKLTVMSIDSKQGDKLHFFAPSEMTKKIWAFVKSKSLSNR